MEKYRDLSVVSFGMAISFFGWKIIDNPNFLFQKMGVTFYMGGDTKYIYGAVLIAAGLSCVAFVAVKYRKLQIKNKK